MKDIRKESARESIYSVSYNYLFLGGESQCQSFFFVLQFSLCLNGFTLNNNYVEEAVAVFSFSFELGAVSGDCVVVLSVSSSSQKPIGAIHH